MIPAAPPRTIARVRLGRRAGDAPKTPGPPPDVTGPPGAGTAPLAPGGATCDDENREDRACGRGEAEGGACCASAASTSGGSQGRASPPAWTAARARHAAMISAGDG